MILSFKHDTCMPGSRSYTVCVCLTQVFSGRTVEVVCIDWISQRGQLIYHVTYTSSLYPVVAYSGPQATSRFILPAGENSVTVVVSNSAGTKTVLQPVLLSIPR